MLLAVFPVALDVPAVVVGAEALLLAEVLLVVVEAELVDVVLAEHALEVELAVRLVVEVVDLHRRRNHKKLL